MCPCFSYFPLISHHLHSCTLVTLKWNTCARKALLLVLLLILPACLGRSMPTALTAFLRNALLAAIQMSWSTPSIKALGWWVIFHPCSFSFLFLHLNTCFNNLSLKIQPIVQEHKDLILLATNVKLELTEYSRQLYGGGMTRMMTMMMMMMMMMMMVMV